MATASVGLAKLTRPKLFRVIDRERLFRQLDSAREQGSVWVTGAPGAGKTSLAASYLRARRLQGVWYDVDSGDADPACLFQCLSLAAPKPRGKNPAPLLNLHPGVSRRSAELHPPLLSRVFCSLAANRRRRVRQLSHGTARCAIQRDSPRCSFRITLIMLGRTDPPASLALAQANPLLARLGSDDLRLTADEMREIVLAERRYDYFAGQVLALVDPPTRVLLVRAAFQPRVTVTAARELTGNQDAGLLLEALFRQRLFTDRHEGAEVSFQFHALFARFLQSFALAALSVDELRALRAASARLLEQSRESSAALKLWVDNEDWRAATALIVSEARALVADGRWLNLERMDRTSAEGACGRQAMAHCVAWECADPRRPAAGSRDSDSRVRGARPGRR